MMGALKLGASALTLEEVWEVAVLGRKVELSSQAIKVAANRIPVMTAAPMK